MASDGDAGPPVDLSIVASIDPGTAVGAGVEDTLRHDRGGIVSVFEEQLADGIHEALADAGTVTNQRGATGAREPSGTQ